MGVYFFMARNFFFNKVLPCFLSPFPASMEVLCFPSLYVLSNDVIVLPLLVPNTFGCRTDVCLGHCSTEDRFVAESCSWEPQRWIPTSMGRCSDTSRQDQDIGLRDQEN